MQIKYCGAKNTKQYLEKSNHLFRTSDKYLQLLNAINNNIALQNKHEKNKNFIEASDLGIKIWEDLKQLIKLIGANCLYEIDYESSYDLLYWASTQSDMIWRTGTKEKDKRLLDNHFKFCKEYVKMHEDYLDKEVRNLGNVRVMFAERYNMLKDFETYDSLYQKWLAKEPDWGWGWIAWSDGYWLFNFRNKQMFSKAEEILKKGLSIKNVFDKQLMQERLKELKTEKLKKSLHVVDGGKM